ncbi:MAG: GNAT family N-acetyltransferase [Methanobrevibacter thaueri]|nr:GNAT family N-acetyltransferase [Methanobrevibacter thaueri]
MIKTRNLILRHWENSDAQELYNLAKNPNIGPVAGWPPHANPEESLNIIKTILSRDGCYAIVKDDNVIGCAELFLHPNCNHWWGEGSAEIGYWIGEEYQNKGYATEASQALIKKAFNDLNVNQIYASYKKENIASKRVLEKLGFKYYTELTNVDYQNQAFYEIAMKLEK